LKSPSAERLQVNRPTIIDETIDGEVVVVDLQRGTYYSIRGTGVMIWEALTVPQTPAAVVKDVAARCRQAEADLAATVTGFIAELREHDLLQVAEAESAPSPPLAVSGEPEAFAEPKLEVFTDMEDLLLLDPVHDVDARGWPHPAKP
jgi:hypothetical protein